MGLISDLQKSILNEVSTRIVKYGFDGKPKVQDFYKKIPSGRQVFHLSFIRHKEDIDITVDVAVRFDSVEDLINEYKPYLTKTQKKDTATLGCELGNLIEGEPRRFSLYSVDDAGDVADEIIDFFARVGISYLEKYSDMEAALEALSGDDRDAWLHMPFHDERAKKAIALAFLLGPKDKFHKIAAAKEEFLTSRNEQGLETFLKLKNDLAAKLNE